MAYRILLVDDEHQLRRMVGEILEQEGWLSCWQPTARRGKHSFAGSSPTRCCWM